MTTSADPGGASAPGTVDVLIVGAGLSGIGAACRLQTEAPDSTYTILEARDNSGGTWDLFTFPGIRSDSDMFTLGYPFRPWSEENAIVGGADILRYLRQTAQEFGVDQRVEYRSRVTHAQWSTADCRWTVTVQHAGSAGTSIRTCRFLYLCTGYFRYDQGYQPSWPGREDFSGDVLHPQQWPHDFQVRGKRVVVVGSGATAVTLVPALAQADAAVTMVQRSPSYLMPLPAQDPVADLLRRVLPRRQALRAIRWKNVRIATTVYGLCRRYPNRARGLLRRAVAKQLPPGYDVDTHFTPSYQPWDQRLCMVPGGDFFAAIRCGAADVVTDHVVGFTPTGLALRSGATVEADVVVTATGLELLVLGGIALTVDSEAVRIPERVTYKAMMLADGDFAGHRHDIRLFPAGEIDAAAAGGSGALATGAALSQGRCAVHGSARWRRPRISPRSGSRRPMT